MLNLREINDFNLAPILEIDDVEFAFSNSAIFSTIDNTPTVCLHKERVTESLNFLSHLNWRYPVVVLDDESFSSLKNRFLELRSDQRIGTILDENESEVPNLDNFLQTEDDVLNSENSAPIIQFVNALFVQAMKQRATDIHIETYEKEGIVRFRVDGVLKEFTKIKKGMVTSIINRIKVISNLDIAENRVPQDGRTKITIAQKQIDIRVSILPTYYGEKSVMRLLMKSDTIPNLADLGFNQNTTARLKSLLKHSYGMVLITGPTGSGKSTTLHSFLKNVDHKEKNIVTVENPVEYNAFGINQVQVNEKVGLTFAESLRSILRQDPDVILVGEIRDTETARIAVQAAMTGHLLLSTLHTNNSAGAVARLVDMGIDSFLVSSTILGVLAQRLVRVLCPHCKEQKSPDSEDIEYFNLPRGTKVYEPKGCKECTNSGFIGRKAIGEMILADDGLKEVIKKHADEHSIKEYLKNDSGFIGMFDQLRDLIIAGETSISEAIRIGVKEL